MFKKQSSRVGYTLRVLTSEGLYSLNAVRGIINRLLPIFNCLKRTCF